MTNRMVFFSITRMSLTLTDTNLPAEVRVDCNSLYSVATVRGIDNLEVKLDAIATAADAAWIVNILDVDSMFRQQRLNTSHGRGCRIDQPSGPLNHPLGKKSLSGET